MRDDVPSALCRSTVWTILRRRKSRVMALSPAAAVSLPIGSDTCPTTPTTLVVSVSHPSTLCQRDLVTNCANLVADGARSYTCDTTDAPNPLYGHELRRPNRLLTPSGPRHR